MRHFVAGSIAGMAGVVVGQPLDVLKVRMQTQEMLAAATSTASAQLQANRHKLAPMLAHASHPPALIVDTPSYHHSNFPPRSFVPSGSSSNVRNFPAPSYYQRPIFSIGGGLSSGSNNGVNMRGRNMNGTLSTQSFSSTLVRTAAGPAAQGATAARAGASAAAAVAVSAPPLFSTPLSCFLSTLRGSGIRGLYRGMSTPLLLVGVQKSVAFGVFGTVAQHLQGSKPLPSLSDTCVAGVAGGMANSLILTPIDQIKIAMQIQSYGAATTAGATAGGLEGAAASLIGGSAQPSMLNTAATIFKEQGFYSGIYGNFRATLLREIPMYSVYYTLYSALHRTFIVDELNRSRFRPTSLSTALPARGLLSDHHKEMLTKLTMGGLTGVGCWASCYCLDTVKTSMVAQTAQNIRAEERKNIRQMIKHMHDRYDATRTHKEQ